MNFEMKIAIQGEKGSFHDVAARQYFGSDEIELVECPTFDMTVNAAKQGTADFAVWLLKMHGQEVFFTITPF